MSGQLVNEIAMRDKRIAELEAALAKAEKYSRLPEAAADRIKELEAALREIANGEPDGTNAIKIAREIVGYRCDHNWVSAINEVVRSGEVCTKCHTIRAEGESDE